MSTAQLTFPRMKFDFNIRPTLRLRVIEELLRDNRMMDPVPSRMTIIAWIESGVLEGRKTPTGFWLVYQDSFERFVRNLQSDDIAA